MSLLTSLRIKGCYVALLLVLLSVTGLAVKGLNLGLGFSGGYLTEFTTSSPISQQNLQEELVSMGFVDARINSADDNQRWTLRLQDRPSQVFGTPEIQMLSEATNTQIVPLDSVYIGGQVGAELLEQGGLALLVAAIAVMLYLSMRFEWRLATGALFALVHDVLIVLGVFAWFELSFDLAAMAAILAIIGYSLNDSIVIGDRIRELLSIKSPVTLEYSTKRIDGVASMPSIDQIIDHAVQSTFTRTLITSGTTLATIASIWILAGKPLEGFSIALFVGVIVGSVSSITISASLPTMFGLDAEYYRSQAEVLETEL